MFYRIIDDRKLDQFESENYTNKAKAIADCKAEFSTLTPYDRRQRSAFFVAAFRDPDDIEPAAIVYNAK